MDAVRARGSEIPVLAAGGIADGRGLAAALILGADGVLVGTRFIAAEESLAPPAAKARIVDACGDMTVRTRVFDMARGLDWPAHYTGRALSNRFSDRWHGREDQLSEVLAPEQARYAVAAAEQDYDTAVIFAGEDVDLIHKVQPARDIVRDLVAEATGALARVALD